MQGRLTCTGSRTHISCVFISILFTPCQQRRATTSFHYNGHGLMLKVVGRQW